eukprot:Nitzschia sp. Nitz4//scaffold77_size91520//51907//54384//NITZ4_004894-RA/size91520-augustus-gene-0.74-mRNA-1//-1//CDS//3329558003//7879//frame0
MASYVTGPSTFNSRNVDTSKDTKVQISIYASKLPNVAGFGKGTSDPYAVVTLLSGGPQERPHVLGKTEVIKNNLNPAWTRVFETTYSFGKESRFNVGIFDEIRKTGKSKTMGSAVFEIGEVLGSRGNIKAKKLKHGGTVYVRITRAASSPQGTLTMKISGVQLKNVEGFFGGKSDPFFVVSSQTNDAGGATWHPVYRSDPIKNDLNPKWETFSLSLEQLCNGDKDRPFQLEVFDWEKSGKHRHMGTLQSTVNGLLFLLSGSDKKLQLMHKGRKHGAILVESVAISGEKVGSGPSAGGASASAATMAMKAEANHNSGPPKKFVKVNGINKINPEYKKWKEAQQPTPAPVPAPAPATTTFEASAPVMTNSMQASAPAPYGALPPPLPPPILPSPEPTNPAAAYGQDPQFVDYISGGTEISLVVAVDYTGSNGDPRKPGTLHYIHPDGQLNDYEKALTAVGSVIARYDTDQMFPMLGFGAKYGGVIQHCFQIGGAPELRGIDGMLQGYRGVFRTGLTMSGPTVFAEVIQYAAAQARSKQEANASVGEQSYTILLILTDGAVSDIELTKTAIRNASSAPLSIVIVGIGNADFSAMQFLDDFQSSEGGSRDIVQFVEFNKHKHDKQALTRETLDEIPEQLVGFFKSRNIMPLPPTSGSKLNIVAEDYNAEEDIDLAMSFHDDGNIHLTNPNQAQWDGQTYGTASFYSKPSAPPAYAPSNGGGGGAYVTAQAVPAPMFVNIQAPSNAYPGMQLQVQNPQTGQYNVVTIPPGVAPGSMFAVQL